MARRSKAIVRESKNADTDFYRDVRGLFQGRPPKKLELHHVGTNNQLTDVALYDDFEGQNPDTIAENVLTRAHSDAATMPGFQRYAVLCWYEDRPKYNERIIFSVQGGGEDEMSLGGTEAPDERGERSQSMRHTEAAMRMLLDTVQKVLVHDREEATRKDEVIERFQATQIATMEALQNILDKTAERDLRVKRQEKNYEMFDEAIEKLSPIAMVMFAEKMKDKNPALAQVLMATAMSNGKELPQLGSNEMAPLRVLYNKLQSEPARFETVIALLDKDELVAFALGDMAKLAASLEETPERLPEFMKVLAKDEVQLLTTAYQQHQSQKDRGTPS